MDGQDTPSNSNISGRKCFFACSAYVELGVDNVLYGQKAKQSSRVKLTGILHLVSRHPDFA